MSLMDPFDRYYLCGIFIYLFIFRIAHVEQAIITKTPMFRKSTIHQYLIGMLFFNMAAS